MNDLIVELNRSKKSKLKCTLSVFLPCVYDPVEDHLRGII